MTRQYTYHDSIVATFLQKEVSDIRHYADHSVVVLNSGEEIPVEPILDGDHEAVWELYTSSFHGHLFNPYIEESKQESLTGL